MFIINGLVAIIIAILWHLFLYPEAPQWSGSLLVIGAYMFFTILDKFKKLDDRVKTISHYYGDINGKD